MWLLCQPGERLCSVRLCYGCCQKRINMSAVSTVPGVSFQPLSLHFAYPGFNEQCKQYESESESCSVMFNSLRPHGLYNPWNSPGQNTEDSLLQGIFPIQEKPKPPALQADSLPAEPQGKPKNAGWGSLSLLKRIFLTQESNRGLLHCWWILYQLSYHA